MEGPVAIVLRQVVSSETGYLVTNNHVVEDAEDISVMLENGDKFPATLIGADARTDVALLKVKASQQVPT
jgi:serine protease Do